MRALCQVQALSARENDNGQYIIYGNWNAYKRKGTSFCRRNSIGGKSGSLTVITDGYCSGFLTFGRRKSFYDSVKNMSIIKFVFLKVLQNTRIEDSEWPYHYLANIFCKWPIRIEKENEPGIYRRGIGSNLRIKM